MDLKLAIINSKRITPAQRRMLDAVTAAGGVAHFTFTGPAANVARRLYRKGLAHYCMCGRLFAVALWDRGQEAASEANRLQREGAIKVEPAY